MPVAPPFMLTTGPVTAYPAVLNAMARPVLYDGHPDFQFYYRDVIGKAQRALRLSNLPVILQADALLGLEVAAASLIGRKDVVLNLVSGVYGKGYAGGGDGRCGGEVIELEVPFDEAIASQAVSRALAVRPDISIIAVGDYDTPSGTLNPLAEIGTIVRAHGCLNLIADAVSSFGGMDVHPEESSVTFSSPGRQCLGDAGVDPAGHQRPGLEAHQGQSGCAARLLPLALDWDGERSWPPFSGDPLPHRVPSAQGRARSYLAEGRKRSGHATPALPPQRAPG